MPQNKGGMVDPEPDPGRSNLRGAKGKGVNRKLLEHTYGGARYLYGLGR